MNKISIKIGLLFSSIFLILLLLLGYMLYGLFSNFFIDFISQDLLQRGENHAKVLEKSYNETTITHVALMEKDVVTDVIVTDENKNIIAFSGKIEDQVWERLQESQTLSKEILNDNWKKNNYIISISPIQYGEKGYVFMFYPTSIIKDAVLALRIFILIASVGIVLVAIGLIGHLSKKMTTPLIKMKEVTNRIAEGDFNQSLEIEGTDELAQLGYSIQTLGQQLSYYDNSRNEFLAGVSHELRTPLTYIKGYADVLRKGMIKNEKDKQRHLDIIYEETKRVNHLVNDLFDIAKIQTGNFEIRKQKSEITQLMEQVVETLAPLAMEKGIRLQVEAKENELFLFVDPERIKQVFYNLIENAIKYSDSGMVDIGVSSEKGKVIIKVTDQGRGIPEIELPRIWERFYRVEKSRERDSGGTGLGLYVVKQIVSLHGGEIYVDSIEGKGTSFTIIFRNDVMA